MTLCKIKWVIVSDYISLITIYHSGNILGTIISPFQLIEIFLLSFQILNWNKQLLLEELKHSDKDIKIKHSTKKYLQSLKYKSEE